jgi:DegV family protein with EDD domain
MKSTCIVTDSSAQFSKTSFADQSFIKIIPLGIAVNGLYQQDDNKSDPSALPQYADARLGPRVTAPTPEEFYKLFFSLSQTYDNIIAIFISNQLVPCCDNAQLAAHSLKGRTNIILIDSMTFSAGLGYLVQLAADGISKNIPILEIERQIRSILPSIYSIVSPSGLSYLYYNGFVDKAQGVINEMLGLYPIFTIENGKLIPLEKVKSPRNAIGFFQEFLDEFEQLNYIAFIQSALPQFQEHKILRDNYQRESPTPYTEHMINFPLSVLLGPGTMAMIIIESSNTKKK